MKPARSLVLLVLAASILSIPPTSAATTLANPGFELGSLEGWTPWGNSACEFAIAADAIQGAYSFAWRDTSTSASCGLYQTVAVQAGSTYVARATFDVTEGTPQLFLRWVDALGQDVGTFPSDTARAPGRSELVAEGVAPGGATHARIWIYSTTAQTSAGNADATSLELCVSATCSPPAFQNDCGTQRDAPDAHGTGVWVDPPYFNGGTRCSGWIGGADVGDNFKTRAGGNGMRLRVLVEQGAARVCVFGPSDSWEMQNAPQNGCAVPNVPWDVSTGPFSQYWEFDVQPLVPSTGTNYRFLFQHVA